MTDIETKRVNSFAKKKKSTREIRLVGRNCILPIQHCYKLLENKAISLIYIQTRLYKFCINLLCISFFLHRVNSDVVQSYKLVSALYFTAVSDSLCGGAFTKKRLISSVIKYFFLLICIYSEKEDISTDRDHSELKETCYKLLENINIFNWIY